MKRNIIVSNLIKEGFSEKTLVRFTDKQLIDLHERMTVKAADLTDPNVKKIVNDPSTQVQVVKEKKELKGGQKKLDKNHNGVIDGQDFKILRGQKKEVKEDMKVCKECGKLNEKCECKKEEVNEVDMGLTLKGSKSISSSMFGGLPKKSSSPKKSTQKEENDDDTTEEEMDESLHNLMIGVTKEKLKKDLGREPEDHEIDEELGKFVDSWKKDKESKEEGNKKEEDESKKPSEGLSKEKKSEVVKKAKKGEDIGKKGKGFEKLADKAAKQYGSKEKGEKVAAAAMWKNVHREGIEVKNWVSNLVENEKFHSFTSKNEIMELIQSKLNESDTMVQSGPKVKKGHNGIPEFMTYDAIKSSGPAVAPTKPKPTTKPGTKPGEKPKTPYQPGPGPNPKPKASYE